MKKLEVYGAVVATLALVATLFQVPEFRQRFLEKRPDDTAPQRFTPPARSPADSSVGAQPWREVTHLTATASSILPPSRVGSYGPEKVLDGRWGSAWVEDAEGRGAGEWIQLRLPTPQTISRIGLVNGYAKGGRFSENGRVQSAVLTFSDGSTQRLQIADSPELQSFSFPPTTTAWIRLTIESVYPGTRWDDTGISEIRLWTRP